MPDFPANSQKAAKETEPRERVKAVTSAEAVRRKRGLGTKFRETFFGGNGRDALSYMTEEVVVPSIRDLLYDALHAGLDQIVYGSARSGRRKPSGPLGMNTVNSSRVAYDQINKGQPTQASRLGNRTTQHKFDDLIIPTLQEANDVLDQMYDVLSRYGQVSQADLYVSVGIRPEHTDEKWGWTNLRGATAVRFSRGRTEGYLLKLPRPEELYR